MVRCAYCGAEGKMSRQHVIPKGFINNMNFKALTVWLDKASSKVINSELMVKDVCAECNNGELSVDKQEFFWRMKTDMLHFLNHQADRKHNQMHKKQRNRTQKSYKQ